MKYLVTILILTFISASLKGQTILHGSDSLKQKIEHAKATKTVALDSISSKGNNALDNGIKKIGFSEEKQADANSSQAQDRERFGQRYDKNKMQLKIDSLNRAEATNSKLSLIDSTTQQVDKVIEKVNAPQNMIAQGIDSLRTNLITNIQRRSNKPDSLRSEIENKERHLQDSLNLTLNGFQPASQVSRLTSRADSLKKATLSTEKFTSRIDSVTALNPVEKLQGNATSVEAKIQSQVQKPTSAINEKLNLLSSEANGQGNLPSGVNTSISPNLSGQLPNAELSKINLGTSNIPSVNQSVIKTPDAKINAEIPGNLRGEPDVTKQLDAANLDNVAEMDKLKKGSSELNTYSGTLSGYNEDVKSIRKGDESDAVSQLPVGEDLTLLQSQEKAFKEQQARIDSYKHPEKYKQQTQIRARQFVAKQVSAYGSNIDRSVAKLSKYQKTMGTVIGAANSMSKKRDAWRKLKSYEKIVPGVTWQILKVGPTTFVDINPTLRYRLTTYWSLGAGWNERVIASRHHSGAAAPNRISGMRLFTEVIIFKGISIRLDAEDVNGLPRLHSGESKGIWTWNYLAGIKKDFTFYRKITGNVQFMYKIYSSTDAQIYASPYNVRFGFEFMPKRRIKIND